MPRCVVRVIETREHVGTYNAEPNAELADLVDGFGECDPYACEYALWRKDKAKLVWHPVIPSGILYLPGLDFVPDDEHAPAKLREQAIRNLSRHDHE